MTALTPRSEMPVCLGGDRPVTLTWSNNELCKSANSARCIEIFEFPFPVAQPCTMPYTHHAVHDRLKMMSFAGGRALHPRLVRLPRHPIRFVSISRSTLVEFNNVPRIMRPRQPLPSYQRHLHLLLMWGVLIFFHESSGLPKSFQNDPSRGIAHVLQKVESKLISLPACRRGNTQSPHQKSET